MVCGVWCVYCTHAAPKAHSQFLGEVCPSGVVGGPGVSPDCSTSARGQGRGVGGSLPVKLMGDSFRTAHCANSCSKVARGRSAAPAHSRGVRCAVVCAPASRSGVHRSLYLPQRCTGHGLGGGFGGLSLYPELSPTTHIHPHRPTHVTELRPIRVRVRAATLHPPQPLATPTSDLKPQPAALPHTLHRAGVLFTVPIPSLGFGGLLGVFLGWGWGG